VDIPWGTSPPPQNPHAQRAGALGGYLLLELGFGAFNSTKS